MDQALGPGAYVACDAGWGTFADRFAQVLRLRVVKAAGADVHLAAGRLAMAQVTVGGRKHFVLVLRRQDGRYWMLDPWHGRASWLDGHYSQPESWRLLFRVDPPQLDTTTRISLHMQTNVPGIIEENTGYIAVARPAGIKRVTEMEDLATYKRRFPWLSTTYRHDKNPEGALQFCDPNGQITSESLRTAGDWLATYSDSLASVAGCGLWTADDPFFMEGPNEFGWAAPDIPKIMRAVSFERSWLVKLGELGLPVAPVCFCAGVGNIGRPGVEEQDFLLLTDLARETVAMNGAFGLHSYWVPGMQAELGRYHAYRFMWIDEVLERAGVRGLKWKLGEGGCAGHKGNPVPLEGGGWRHPLAHNGDWEAYLLEILDANAAIQTWNSLHNNRCIELDLFTVGIGTGWHSFLLKTEEINLLAQALS